MDKIEKMSESKCKQCGYVYFWSKLVLNIEYKCSKCGNINIYNREPSKMYITDEEAKNYAAKRIEEYEKIERARKFSTGGIVPKSSHAADALSYLMKCSTPFIPKGTPLFDSILKQKTQQEYSAKTNYTFQTTCEQAVDPFRIAKDLDEQNYCFHVITENTTEPSLNALLVHRSIFQKALVLDIPVPSIGMVEEFDEFGIFHLDEVDPKEDPPKKLNYSKYKIVMKWINDVRKAKWSEFFPTKIKGKPVSIRVTNCSVGR